MTGYLYRAVGLSIASEIDLPGLVAVVPIANRAIDVRLRLGPVPDAIERPTASGPTWQIAGERFLLKLPRIARVLLTSGREVAIEMAPDALPEAVAPFVTGTVLAILLNQRGRIALHGSAVAIGRGAVLFCGHSGAGKSTLAAALSLKGYPVLSDDLCAIDFDAAQRPLLQPDGRVMKLWSGAIEHLGLADRRGAAVLDRFEKFHIDPVHQADLPAESVPLRAIYELREPQAPNQWGIQPAVGVEAAVVVRRNAFRPELVEAMGQNARYGRAALAIASHAGVHHLTRPFDFMVMAEVTTWIQEHLLSKAAGP